MARPRKNSTPPRQPTQPTPTISEDDAASMLSEVAKPFSFVTSDGKKLTLTQQQTALVRCVSEGVNDMSVAARLCGYASSSSAGEAFRLPHVREAYEQTLRQRLSRLGGLAISTYEHLALNARSEKVRLEAANAISDRIGLAAGATTARTQTSAGGVTVNISLSTPTPPSDASDPDITMERKASGLWASADGGEEGGPGGKDAGLGE